MKASMRVSLLLGVILLIGTAAAAGALLANAADNPTPTEEFTAFAVNMGGAVKSGVVEITIERWCTPEERMALIAAFKEKGQDGLLKALQDTKKVGYIRTPGTMAWDLHYAYQFPTGDGGRNIVIATDRRIAGVEAWNSTRSMDYPFDLIQMHLDAKGKGEGKMSAATRISVSEDGKRIELENYGTAPVSLNSITTKVKK